jgi:signal transduction histidine kinase
MRRVETHAQLVDALEHPWDVVISDYVMPTFSAPAALKILKQRGVDLPFIILSGAIGEETAVAAMRAGAHDYLMKDNLTRLVPAIEREVNEAANRRDRKRAEQALRTADKLATLGRMAAEIAHEVNNPLEAVVNLLYLIETDRTLSPRGREYVEMAQKQLDRVSHIVKVALTFSRSSTAPRWVPLPKLIKDVVDLTGNKIRNRGVIIESRIDYRGEIHIIESEAQQVLSNLIFNAVDALGDNSGKISIHAFPSVDRRDGQCAGVRIVVADTGCGIAAQNREQIFEPFFTTKGTNGTGLGLWITKGLVEKHGGNIRMRTSVRPHRTGTVFSVFFPIALTTISKAASAL